MSRRKIPEESGKGQANGRKNSSNLKVWGGLAFVAVLAGFAIIASGYPTPEAAGDSQASGYGSGYAELFGRDLSQTVQTEEIAPGSGSGTASGFVARPAEPGDYPGIVMIHEWWGLNGNIKEMARLLANEGYVVFAVDLYGGEVATDAARARELVSGVQGNPQKAVQSMTDAASYLKEEYGVVKVASLGWCFGGGQSLQLALDEPLDATVIYYGQLTDDRDRLKNIKGPVLGIFGGDDTSIPVADVAGFTSALGELGVENEIYVYPGVGHAFANPSGDNYAPEQTLDAWGKTVAFLGKHLQNSGLDVNESVPQ